MEILVGICTLYIYIICWKPILQIRSVLRPIVLIMSDCSKISILGRSIKHVTLVVRVLCLIYSYDYVIYRERLGAAKGKQIQGPLLIVDLWGI